MPLPPDAISRAALLQELGYGHPEAAARALDVLVQRGIVNPKRDGMAAAKRELCRATLAGALVRLCDPCVTAGGEPGGRARVPVLDRTFCERCGGSSNRAAVERAAEAFRRDGQRRLVVVGGSPGVHGELKRLWPFDLRIVDGTERHLEREARSNLAWADAVVVWASSELNHKVSEHYTSAKGPERHKVIVVPRRGIEALAERLAARKR